MLSFESCIGGPASKSTEPARDAARELALDPSRDAASAMRAARAAARGEVRGLVVGEGWRNTGSEPTTDSVRASASAVLDGPAPKISGREAQITKHTSRPPHPPLQSAVATAAAVDHRQGPWLDSIEIGMVVLPACVIAGSVDDTARRSSAASGRCSAAARRRASARRVGGGASTGGANFAIRADARAISSLPRHRSK